MTRRTANLFWAILPVFPFPSTPPSQNDLMVKGWQLFEGESEYKAM